MTSGQKRIFVLCGECPKCGCALLIRRRKKDGEKFVACSGFPVCRWACNYDMIAKVDEITADVINVLRAKLEEVSQTRPVNNIADTTIKQFYLKLIREFHPDTHDTNLTPTEITQKITAIFNKG